MIHYFYHLINELIICGVYIITIISILKKDDGNSLDYTNICINLITVSWAINIAFSLSKFLMKIYEKIKGYLTRKSQIAPVTKMTEVKGVVDKEI